MSYTDENGMTAFVQQEDLFECGRRPVDIAHSNFSEHGKGKGYLG